LDKKHLDSLNLNNYFSIYIVSKDLFVDYKKMEQNKEKSSSFFTDKAFDVSITAYSQDNHESPVEWLPSHKKSELGCKVMFAVFDLIRSAALSDSYVQDVEDIFGNVSSKLFTNFNLDNLDKHGSLEGSIKEYIRKLKEYNYFIPNELVELSENKDNLKRFEGPGYESYEGDLDSVVDCFRNILKSLKDEKIAFWNRILEQYNEDKEAYDLEFRTTSTRHKKDLEWVSKIDIDDYVKRFKQVGKKEKN